MSWFEASFGYALGARAARFIFGEEKRPGPAPIRSMTEAEILADEKRFAEDAKRLDEADRAKRS